jgi:hypothetical protein
LAGLPVVSTPSQGGREVYFDHEFCTVCDPDPGAVAKAVESLKSRNIPRDYVRERTLAKIQPVRQSVLALVDSLRERLGGARHHYDGVWRYPEPTWKSYTQHLSEFSRASKTQA